MSDRAIADLARRVGLQPKWEDAAGKAMTVATLDLARILAAMGLPCGTTAEIAESRQKWDARAAAPARLVTAEAGRPVALGAAGAPIAKLHLEGGGARDLRISRGLAEAIAETGYHRLDLGQREITVAVAPDRAFSMADAAPGRRVWGAGAQVYGLRDARGEAFGDFGAVARLAETLGGQGAQALAISPTHALFAADPGRYSPYSPSTRLFLNGLYADPSVMFPDLWVAESEASPPALIDWPSAIPAKLKRLRALHARFSERPDPGRWSDFQAFVSGGGDDLALHGLFEALHGHFLARQGARDWRQWPAAFHDPRGPAVAAFAAEQALEIEFHFFLQWLADRSLAAAQAAARGAGMLVGLIADLAVGMDPGGSHAWSRREDLLPGLSVGAPPDLFQPKGQDWGIATFSPDALRRSGFEAFLATLRTAMRQAGGVRIDHAMGLLRLWVVPQGAGAAAGAYLTYPAQDLMRLLRLESSRQRSVVVAEDLGTVPAGFRETLDRDAVMGMRVLWFEREAGTGAFTPPRKWDAGAAALTTTHDLPTLAGWWRGGDIDWRVKLNPATDEAADRRERAADRQALWRAAKKIGAASGAAPSADAPEAAVRAGIALVAATPCPLAIIALEDLLGLVEQPNLPGTIDEHPNWRRRLPLAVEALPGHSIASSHFALLNRARPA